MLEFFHAWYVDESPCLSRLGVGVRLGVHVDWKELASPRLGLLALPRLCTTHAEHMLCKAENLSLRRSMPQAHHPDINRQFEMRCLLTTGAVIRSG
mmetsp:Transcript_17472/g.29973  ORF Transcript_17472/g.29973 Transcript_17472/m.29973 type:complete len:96 (+) Transcript_17472:1001-1288(+)